MTCAQTIRKTGAGSQNGDTARAISHLDRSKNLTQVCKCIIHSGSDGNGTKLPRTAFNRQGDGIQSMCRQGKTLIDAIKHQCWRAGNLALMSSMEGERSGPWWPN